MNWFKPKIAPVTVVKVAPPTEADETAAWLKDISEKAIAAGALPDTTTAAERITATETHADAGTSWAATHKFVYDEDKAAKEGRLTPGQTLTQEVQRRQIAVKEEQVKRRV